MIHALDAAAHRRRDRRARGRAAHPGRRRSAPARRCRLRPLRRRAASSCRHPGAALRAAAAALSAVGRRRCGRSSPAPRLGEHAATWLAATARTGEPVARPRRRGGAAARRPPRHRLHRVLGRSVRRPTTWPRWAPTSSRSSRSSGPTACASRASRPPTSDGWWEWSALFHDVNLGKRGITLDLGRPAGVELVKRLLARRRRRGRELLAARDGQPRPRATTSSPRATRA